MIIILVTLTSRTSKIGSGVADWTMMISVLTTDWNCCDKIMGGSRYPENNGYLFLLPGNST